MKFDYIILGYKYCWWIFEFIDFSKIKKYFIELIKFRSSIRFRLRFSVHGIIFVHPALITVSNGMGANFMTF
jgi:hypothetical protein